MRNLSIALSGLRGFVKPMPELEQWATPGEIAATMISLAEKDVLGKTVIDLGAGTGILSIGCALAGAGKVIAVEKDVGAFSIMVENIGEAGADNVEPVNLDIADFSGSADTVIMNPPFGAQLAARHLDRVFLEKAFACAPVCYSLHLASTRSFIRSFSEGLGRKDTVLGTFRFPLAASFGFHKKPKKTQEVDYHRTWK